MVAHDCRAVGQSTPVPKEVAGSEQFTFDQYADDALMLLDHLDRDGRPLAADQLGQVRRYSEALLARQTAYRCRNCGFSSHSLMWQCPSCHDWGSCRPIPGADEVR